MMWSSPSVIYQKCVLIYIRTDFMFKNCELRHCLADALLRHFFDRYWYKAYKLFFFMLDIPSYNLLGDEGSVATDIWWPIGSISASALNDDDRVNVSVWPPVPQLFNHIWWWRRKKSSEIGFCTRRALQRSSKKHCCDDFLCWVFLFAF